MIAISNSPCKWKLVQKVIKETVLSPNNRTSSVCQHVIDEVVSSPIRCSIKDIDKLKIVIFILHIKLREGHFPLSWKRSEVEIQNKVNRIFKKIPHLALNKLIPVHQLGFRKNHSTIKQFHRIVT